MSLYLCRRQYMAKRFFGRNSIIQIQIISHRELLVFVFILIKYMVQQ